MNCTVVLRSSSVKAGFHFGKFGHGLSGHVQLKIQAESECLLANVQSVLEVESSSTFS